MIYLLNQSEIPLVSMFTSYGSFNMFSRQSGHICDELPDSIEGAELQGLYKLLEDRPVDADFDKAYELTPESQDWPEIVIDAKILTHDVIDELNDYAVGLEYENGVPVLVMSHNPSGGRSDLCQVAHRELEEEGTVYKWGANEYVALSVLMTEIQMHELAHTVFDDES